MSEADLKPKQQIFIAEYLKDHNGTKAAIAAGYSAKGASTQAMRLLRNVQVSAEIARKQAELLQKLDLSAEKVLQALSVLAFFDIRKFWNEDGSLKQVTELDDETQIALCGLEVEKLYDHFAEGQAKDKGTVTKIKLADRGLNLERLGRHFKLFTDKVELSSSDEVIRWLESGRKRLQGT